jgi:soluble lytic murein transglycosylase-like protein
MIDLGRRAALHGLLAVALSACGQPNPGVTRAATPRPPAAASIEALVDRWADHYGLPRSLVHRVVRRESGYDPAARNGPYYGLMQIHPATARTMGFRGDPAELLDPDTNLRYAVKYLRGAWLVARGDADRAVIWYARGYYDEAKRLGLLEETGLRG